MANKKISEFNILSGLTNDIKIPIVVSGQNFTLAYSAITEDIGSIDVLGVGLSGLTNGLNQPITSGDTILSAFENLQTSKQDLLNVRLSADPETLSFIDIEDDTANVNIVSVSSGQTEITISTETSGSTDTIILNEDGTRLESEFEGNTTSLILSDGFGLSYTGSGIFNDSNGFYIKNPDKILIPLSTISGDSLAKLSDIPNDISQLVRIMTKTERNLINSPTAGLIVYQSDNTPGLRVYNGTNWVRFTEEIDD